MAGFWYSSFCQKTSRKMDIMKGQLLRPCSYHFHAFPRRLPIRNPGPSSGCSLVAENDGFFRSLEELQTRPLEASHALTTPSLTPLTLPPSIPPSPGNH